MVMLAPPTDAASCSHLGGVLRRGAAELVALAVDLPAGHAERARAETLSTRLDLAGSALQDHAQDLAELSAAAERLAREVERSGLVLTGDGLLQEPYGLVTTRTAMQRRARLDALRPEVARLRRRIMATHSSLQDVVRAAVAALHG